jgi:hypothetical protein
MLSTKLPGVFRSRRLALSLLFAIVASVSFSVAAFAGTRIWVPVRWCGVEGAPSMDNPGTVNEATTDDVLWRRHERPTDAIYIPFADMSFRAGATAAIKNGPQSFPIIRDPFGLGGSLEGDTGEANDAVTMCRRAWMMGDPLYFDQNNNSVVNAGTDTLLSRTSAVLGFVDLGHDGAMLKAVPGNVRFVDLDADGNFDIGERIYRDENGNNAVDAGDTLLVETSGTVIGNVDPADVAHPLLPVPDRVRYVDLIRQPPDTFSIGYPAVQGVTGVNANDVNFSSIAFPVHGVAEPGIGGFGAAMDDASQYLPPGPDFTLFETQLVGHEFGHAFSLQHGDGIDDDMDGQLDDADDPAAPFPGAGPGTLCDSNNVMSYCWRDTGTAGNPTMNFIGIDGATSGIFTAAQSDKIRNYVLANMPDRVVDPVTAPLVAARVDTIGEIPSPSEHLDIAEFAAAIDASRSNSVLSLTTRRPFPSASTAVDFHFLVDLDGNRETGVPASAAAVPSDFAGAEFVASVRVRGQRVESVVARRYDSQKREFESLDPNRIKAIVETLEAIPDFPLDLRNTHSPGELLRFPAAELVRVIVPAGLLALPTATAFRVEYLAVDVASGLVDRAQSPGMRFELPVFPQCRTEPGIVDRGDTATVFASGLLPDREVHLLLGADQVGSGHTDAAGSVHLALAIPANARFGPRLVTVGALAVSADCSVTVRDPDAPPGKGEQPPFERCCRRFSIQFWIITALVVIILIVVFIRKH